MSLKDTLTEHANVLRSKTGVSDSLSISDMTRLLDDLSWNKNNLLKGTSNEYKEVTSQLFTCSTSTNRSFIGRFHANDILTYSAYISNPTQYKVFLEIVQYDDKGNWLSSTHSKMECLPNSDLSIYVTDTILPNAKKVIVDAFTDYIESATIKIKDERLYLGTEPGIWTPSPYDLNGKIIINPNLAIGTDDYSGKLWGSYVPSNVTDKFMGLTVKEVYSGGHIGPVVTVPAGDYTYSFFVKHIDGEGNSFNAKARSFDLDTMQEEAEGDTVISGSLNGTDWQRISFTFKNLKAGSYVFMAENWPGTVWVAGQKVESGDILTDYLTKDNRLIDSSDLTGGE